jgi:PAS domain S-box-containing protein
MELKFSGSVQDLPASDRLELLVDAVTDYAIYLLDRDGVIRTWNAGAERIKGYRAAEVIGQHFSLFFTPEDRAADVPGQILASAGRNGRAEQEGWRIRKDGGRFWASSVVQPVRDARGRAVGFAKITRDMTERREAQHALYESERRFRLLVQAVKDCAIYMLDPSGVIVNWNSGAERLKGYFGGGNRRTAFFKILHARGPHGGPARARSRNRRPRRPLRGGRLARAQGRRPVLGGGGGRCNPR